MMMMVIGDVTLRNSVEVIPPPAPIRFVQSSTNPTLDFNNLILSSEHCKRTNSEGED